MKVLFLDIDGVCNSEATFRKDLHAHFPIDPYMAFLVGKIQLETGCEVVLSSSWRHHPESVEHIEKRIVKIFDKTPYSRAVDRDKRGYEIQDWLDAHPEIERYAILDDDDDMLSNQKLFKTSWKTGLTKEIAKEVIEYLQSN